jgi:hypothetical protein
VADNRERAWEIAREIVKPHCVECDDHDYPQSECRKCENIAKQIADALIAFGDAARLEALEQAKKAITSLEPISWENGLGRIIKFDAINTIEKLSTADSEKPVKKESDIRDWVSVNGELRLGYKDDPKSW